MREVLEGTSMSESRNADITEVHIRAAEKFLVDLEAHIPSKQVLIMRHDLGMRKGKMVAQGAHASMAFLAAQRHLRFTAAQSDWFKFGQTKICVRVESEAELLAIHEKALASGLTSHLIRDAGHTEFHGVPTLTCCAIGPNECAAVDAVTGHLKLL